MYKKYTKEQIEYLKKITPGRSYKEITEMFNDEFGTTKTLCAIQGVLVRNNILNGVDATFKKGITPWNKGTKGVVKPNKTSFAKGHDRTPRRPAGSERPTRENAIEVKIRDESGNNVWKTKHVHVWEQANGPVPEGHVIMFGDGNPRNNSLDNLICVSRKQLLGLNRWGLAQNDADLTRTAVNIVDLKYKISEKMR